MDAKLWGSANDLHLTTNIATLMGQRIWHKQMNEKNKFIWFSFALLQAKRKHAVSSDEEAASTPANRPPLRKQSTSVSSTAVTARVHSSDTPPPLKKTKCES